MSSIDTALLQVLSDHEPEQPKWTKLQAATCRLRPSILARTAPTRAHAIRRLVAIGLRVKIESQGKIEDMKGRRDAKQRARELAADAVNEIADTAASPETQVSRKRRLVKGPEEFQTIRRDRPNRK